jgi:hypothetical protein
MGVFINVSPFVDIELTQNITITSIQQLFFLGAIAISVGVYEALEEKGDIPEDGLKEKIISIVLSDPFRDNTGSGSSSGKNLLGRINAVKHGLISV